MSDVYTGAPMASNGNDEAEAKRIRDMLQSMNKADLLEVVKRKELSARQVIYLARRCVDMVEFDERPGGDGDLARQLARAILKHPQCGMDTVKILMESIFPEVWVEIARSDYLDSWAAEELYWRAFRLTNYRDSRYKAVATSIYSALARTVVLSSNIQEMLMGKGEGNICVALAKSPSLSGQLLLRLAELVRDAWNEPLENESAICESILQHDNATDAAIAIIRQIQQYDEWCMVAQNYETTVGQLVELAERCAQIDDCPLRAYRLAKAIFWHDRVTPQAMDELSRSPYGCIWYLVARCELTSKVTLRKIAQKIMESSLYSESESLFKGIVCELLRHPDSSEEIIEILTTDDGDVRRWETVALLVPYSYHAGEKTLSKLAESKRYSGWKEYYEVLEAIAGNPRARYALVKHCVTELGKASSHLLGPETVFETDPETLVARWREERGEKLQYSSEFSRHDHLP